MISRYLSDKRNFPKEGSRRLLKTGLNSQVKKWLAFNGKKDEPGIHVPRSKPTT